MILPQPKLIWWACAWAGPAVVVATVAPAAADLAMLALAVAMLPTVFDAIYANRRSRGIRVELPAMVRTTQDQKALMPLRIVREQGIVQRLRIGLPMPPDLHCSDEDQTVLLPPEVKCQVDFTCLPRKRGRYLLDRCYIGVISTMGFWLYRTAVQAQGEVRVYPDLSREKRRLAGMFLNRGNDGMHAQRQIGHGRDFEQLRDYVHGDSYDEICWKATARRGVPITKVFQLERTQEVYVLIDSSRLSAKPVFSPDPQAAAGQTSLDRSVAAAMVLGLVAERQGDRFGVISFSDGVDNFIRANTGKDHYRACREAVYSLRSSTVTPDFTELFSFVRLRLRGRALLVLLTDLDDPILAENFIESVQVISGKHLVMANMILPPDVDEVFSDADAADLDAVYQDLSGHLQFARLRELQKVLRQRDVGFYFTQNEQLCPELVRQYLSIKKRQLL